MDLERNLGLTCSFVQVEQHAFDRVHVPGGWPHQVFNHKAAIKIAWDFMHPSKFDLYHWHHKELIANYLQYQKQGAAEVVEDYVGVADILTRHLMNEDAIERRSWSALN